MDAHEFDGLTTEEIVEKILNSFNINGKIGFADNANVISQIALITGVSVEETRHCFKKYLEPDLEQRNLKLSVFLEKIRQNTPDATNEHGFFFMLKPVKKDVSTGGISMYLDSFEVAFPKIESEEVAELENQGYFGCVLGSDGDLTNLSKIISGNTLINPFEKSREAFQDFATIEFSIRNTVTPFNHALEKILLKICPDKLSVFNYDVVKHSFLIYFALPLKALQINRSFIVKNFIERITNLMIGKLESEESIDSVTKQIEMIFPEDITALETIQKKMLLDFGFNEQEIKELNNSVR